MKFLPILLLLPVALPLSTPTNAQAQRRPRRVQLNISDSDNTRNDVEGAVWEFKVMDSKSKEVKLSGNLRMDQSAVFALIESEQGPRRRRGNAQKQERVGDIIKSKGPPNNRELTIRFDDDDEHPLSGTAVIKTDTAGVFVGRYTDDDNKRWRFELRKVED